ncbi:MMB_0454 family protein [Mycoplasmopsis felis]|uniref:MMB_0454 family protein n=1 Tax=Mycoplasmopsis felis TaxID=33923 RepID=UPI003A4DEA70
MSNEINVYYNSDQVYIIKQEAIYDVLNSVLESYNNVKLNKSINLKFENNSNVWILVDIKIKEQNSNQLYEIINKLTKDIDSVIKSLIDKSPKNIQIVFSGYY